MTCAGTKRSRLSGALLLAAVAAFLAGCGSAPAVDAATGAFGRPGRLVELEDGRRINLRCAGRGSPTVILESGFGASSAAWARVQPQLSRTTRVCAYDRAGYGFSDPGPLPRDGAAIARDLDAALERAGIEGPFVVAGHSAGGLYGRLFAGRRPGEVRGFVLVDPTVEGRAPPGRDGLDGIRRRLRRCLAAAEAQPQPPEAAPDWEGCAPARADVRTREIARNPATWLGQLSELDAIFGRTSEAVNRMGGLLDEIPMYVLTASETAAAAQQVGFEKPVSMWELQHVRLALGSRGGSQRTVLSSHLVMNERPEVVIETIQTMVRAVRAGTPPEPLPLSETSTLGNDPASEQPR
ncbi:MAG: alpha/beta hydrolase [Phenylobacterium sp.]|uniref:alpha/beta fold hydrolase n=1 Tax=Phenylobacterium sp. TaxID=1871053 RepID=UPI001A4AAE12|nr:alpha/beta hydrolase [Phenylobacterium sp.]MBL8772707.1 alpha/beta hydrolase [Phenylobacterium sp.]